MYDSTDVARAAIKLAITSSRSAEEQLIKKFEEKDIRGIAVDVGGNIIDTIHIVIERAILASRRNGITSECHVDD
ncbi:MAG: HutP family protein, partial [Peptostreptococcales bacterium]